MLRKPGSRAMAEVAELDAASPGAWEKSYPALWSFLTATAFPDGDRRQPGTILLFLDQGRLKACLSDRECSEVAFVTGSTPESLLERVEVGLASCDLDWRPANRGGGGKRRN